MPASEQYIQPFLDYLKFQKRYSRHTLTAYERDLIDFFDFVVEKLGDMPLADVKPAFIRSWLAGLREEGLEPRSISRKISTLKSFFKYQLRQGSVRVTPMTTISSPKQSKRLPQFVDKKDITTLFDHVTFAEGREGQTERLILEIFYHTGIRLSELTGLKKSHVDGYKQCIKVLGKGNKERIIPVSRELLASMQQYIAGGTTTSDLLFEGKSGKKLAHRYVYTVVKKYLSLVTTIEKRSPHVLRHSFATHLMNNGADLNAVKELLGHNSLAATQVYTHNSIEKLKEIHKKAHPKA